MNKKLVIEYEYADRAATTEFNNPPSFYNDDEWIIFSKGVLADRELQHDRILQIYTTETIYSVYEEGLKALADET